MDKYAIISSARDSSCYHIVETRFIYKTDENGVKPITAEDLKFDDLFVRKIGLHLNGVSIIDTNDNPYDLRKTYSAERRIRMQKIPQYSPKITLTKKSGKEIKKPNSQNNALRAASQEADNHFHNMLSLTTTNEPEETEEDEETEETEETEIRAENESRMDIEINHLGTNSNEESEIPTVPVLDLSPATPRLTLSNMTIPSSNSVITPQNVEINNSVPTPSSIQPTYTRRIQMHRRPQSLSFLQRLRKLETTINILANTVNKMKKNNSKKTENTITKRTYPNLKETIEVIDNEQITVIGDVRITAEKYATILQATTMRKRANCILKLLWKPEELESMYVKTNSTDASQIKINADDRKKF